MVRVFGRKQNMILEIESTHVNIPMDVATDEGTSNKKFDLENRHIATKIICKFNKECRNWKKDLKLGIQKTDQMDNQF